MSRGACIIASNSGDLDYVGLAVIAAKLVREHLSLPVCLLSTDVDKHDDFDEVRLLPSQQASTRTMLKGSDFITYDWKNNHRIDAFDHTPWERTLLIDADYMVLSDMLLPMVESDQPFLIVDRVHDITGRNIFRGLDYLPDKTIKQRWATVMAFDRRAKSIFDAAKMVRQNYDYYASMFNYPSRPFRNDYAFTIAAHLLSVPALPFAMPQSPADSTVDTDHKGIKITYANNVLRWNSDLHILNKDIALDPSRLEALL